MFDSLGHTEIDLIRLASLMNAYFLLKYTFSRGGPRGYMVRSNLKKQHKGYKLFLKVIIVSVVNLFAPINNSNA